MNFSRVLVASILLVVGTASVGCAPSGADDLAGAGSSLEPDFKPGKGKHGRGKGKQGADKAVADGAGKQKPKGERDGSRKPKKAPSNASSPSGSPSPAASSSTPDSPATTSSSTPTATPTATPTKSATKGPDSTSPTPTNGQGAGSASVSDARGDVRGSLTGAPAYADAVGAVVTRTAGGFEVRIQVAGTLPQVWDGSNVENVVAFFDVDLDGQVDYEAWGHLAEEGWSASSRSPSGARFGAASGVTATPVGDTLVLSFPASVVGDASSFQWSVATEFGSLAQVASGTTASDFAPDSGGVRFPA